MGINLTHSRLNPFAFLSRQFAMTQTVTEKSPMDITIAICTWNRADLLDQTLAQFHSIVIPNGVTWELIVVNNNCTDHTIDVVRRHSRKLPIRHVLEPKQGHCHSRNTAVELAAGRLILWTDDDVLVDPDWIVAYLQAAEAYPNASIFGGTIDPWFAVDPPGWIKTNMNRLAGSFAVRQLGPDVRPLDIHESPFGANMAFRLDALRQFRFDPRLGRVGAGLIGADETDVINRMRKSQHQAIWVGPARVRHWIPTERLTKQFVWKFIKGLSRTECRRSKPQDAVCLFGAPRWALRRYLVARTEMLLYAISGDKRWLTSFLDAAYFKGIIEECRSSRQTSSVPGTTCKSMSGFDCSIKC